MEVRTIRLLNFFGKNAKFTSPAYTPAISPKCPVVVAERACFRDFFLECFHLGKAFELPLGLTRVEIVVLSASVNRQL